MTLTLNILRCPDAVPPETRRLDGGEFSIGRGSGNDWVLADPDRHLSKRHCVLAYRQGAWQLADTSTNGTFLNRDAEPIGAGAPRTLRDGDRLRLGAYEIEIGLSDEAPLVSGWADRPASGRASGARAHAGMASPFDEDPFASESPAASGSRGRSAVAAFDAADSPFGDRANPSVQLPSDFDPMAPAPDEAPFGAASQSDHSPVLEDAFQPPQPHPGPGLLPENWDLDEPLTPPPQVMRPVAPRPDPPRPTPQAINPLPEDPWQEPALPPPVTPPGVAPPPIAPPQSAPPQSAPPPIAPRSTAPATGTDLMTAFLAGAELDGPAPRDPDAAMRALGAAFRATVSGLRESLIARAEIKGEFRIEQTMIRTRGNNPLKFSANDDDALAALLGAGRRVDMTPAAAIDDALRDMRLHELATVAAMQKAVRELLARLDPATLRHASDEAGGGLPLQRKARAWSAFEKLHGEISRALADDFDSVFGRAFARAYEQALAEAASHKDTP